MKKHLLMLLFWTMLLIGTFCFSSCGGDDDDDNDATSKAIIGTWIYNEAESGTTLGFKDDDAENYAYDFEEITFNEDGTYVGTTFYNTTYKGTYSLSGNTFTMSGKGFGKEILFEKNAVVYDGDYYGFNLTTTVLKLTVDINGDKMTKKLSLKNKVMGVPGQEDITSIYYKKN